MNRQNIIIGSIISSLILLVPALAQQEEKLTITTYYPSPTGSYQTLKVFGSAEFNAARAGGHDHVRIHGLSPATWGVLSFSAYNGANDVNTAGIWGSIESNTIGSESGGLIFATKNNPDSLPVQRVHINKSGNVGIGNAIPEAKVQISKNDGANGAAGLRDFGIVTTATGGQATLGAEYIGDGHANLNLGQNQTGTRRFWHISSRISTAPNPYSLAVYNYNGTAFNKYIDVTTTGQVTKPAQVAFVATYSGSISAPNWMVWNNVVTNIGNCYSSSTGRFTAPVSGMYMFGFHILLPKANTGEYRFAFYKNGSQWDCAIYDKHPAVATAPADNNEANTWHTIALTDIVYLNAGDTFGVYYKLGSGAAYNDANYNRFWGYFLG